MVTTLAETDRTARKAYRCGMCARPIKPGDRHHVQTNVYDGRVYDWRECLPCHHDRVVNYVSDFIGGWNDNGVSCEEAVEWAQGAAMWPRHWHGHNRPVHPAERAAARAWLARAAGGEGE